jgi:hypothetical protein
MQAATPTLEPIALVITEIWLLGRSGRVPLQARLANVAVTVGKRTMSATMARTNIQRNQVDPSQMEITEPDTPAHSIKDGLISTRMRWGPSIALVLGPGRLKSDD